jgi:conjugal transfer pilus assembly protein TraK
MTYASLALLAAGTSLASRQLCNVSRWTGTAMLGAGALMLASPALAADETLLAVDNGEVACTVSANGLTRVSLKDDRFASVSKLTTGNETDDFTVVNEPTRGDIYISVPEGYSKQTVSFFGTTGKGFTYKFACRTGAGDAHQVFVHNRDILAAEPAEAARRASPQDTSVALVQAMYANASLDGFEIRQPLLPAVYVGSLKVQMISEYRGLEVAGRVLRIENKGRKEATLDERTIAPSNAVAVSVAKPILKAGEITTAYIVLPAGVSQ